MPKFKVDTKASLFEPVEIEIDGKIFKVKKITREIIQEVEKLDKDAAKGDADSVFKRLELLIGEGDEINRLGIDDVVEITKFIIENAFSPKAAEKNSSRPGLEKSLS